jgi:hypothetical protein
MDELLVDSHYMIQPMEEKPVFFKVSHTKQEAIFDPKKAREIKKISCDEDSSDE